MTKGLDAESKAIYDRQLRLWGYESQERLLQSRILIVRKNRGKSCTFAMHEFLKNIALVGVRNMVFLNEKKEDEEDGNHGEGDQEEGNQDVETGYFQEMDIKGLTNRLQEWNPHLSVETIDEFDSLRDLTKNTIVVVFGQSETWSKWEKICLENNVKWMAVDSHGLFSSLYVNARKHEYYRQVVVREKVGDEEALKGYEKETIEYPDCSGTEDSFLLQMPNLADRQSKRARQKVCTEALFLMRSFWNLSRTTKSDRESARNVIENLKNQSGCPLDFSDTESLVLLVERNFERDIHAVGSIMGGIVAQELIKVISLKEDPVRNWLIFDGRNSTGAIFCSNT